jgi:hypothetical protein
MALSFLPDLNFKDSISAGESEKKAVSDPETRPEKKIRIISIIRPIIVSVPNPERKYSDRIFNPDI